MIPWLTKSLDRAPVLNHIKEDFVFSKLAAIISLLLLVPPLSFTISSKTSKIFKKVETVDKVLLVPKEFH